MSSSDRFNSIPGAPESLPGTGFDSSRRRLLRAAGSAVVLIPTVSLFGCSGEEQPAASAASQAEAMKEKATAAASKAQEMAQETADSASAAMDSAMDSMKDAAGSVADSAQQAAGDAMDSAQGAMKSAADAAGGAGGLVKIEESDPVAKALAYVHDASKVDTAAQPRYAAGQVCTNCAQYKAVEGGWGSCAIFPGKLVAGGGWCAGYIAAS